MGGRGVSEEKIESDYGLFFYGFIINNSTKRETLITLIPIIITRVARKIGIPHDEGCDDPPFGYSTRRKEPLFFRVLLFSRDRPIFGKWISQEDDEDLLKKSFAQEIKKK